MYQHPQALHLNADHFQREALRDAEARRLVHGHSDDEDERVLSSTFQRRMVALAVALVTVLGAIALI
jgi:hypothetical protein